MSRFKIQKTCKVCGSYLLAEMIAATPTAADATRPILAHTLPVFLCPTCDSGAVPGSRALHEELDKGPPERA